MSKWIAIQCYSLLALYALVIFLLESHLKANIFQHLNVFLVIGMGKEEKKIMWESQRKHTFWFSLVKKEMMAFSFSLIQVVSKNYFGAQMHKQVNQHNGSQPRAEGRSGKRTSFNFQWGEKERWRYAGERSHTTPYNVEPLHSLKFLFLPLEFNTKQ